MGNDLKKLEYSRQVKDSQKPGSSSIYRNPVTYDGNFIADFYGADTIQKALLNCYNKYGSKNHLYTRDSNGVYKPKTYKETFEFSEKIGKGILKLNLVHDIAEYKHYKLKLLGIFSKNKQEWSFVDMASVLYNFTTIPFYDTLGSETISFMLNHTNLITVICDKIGVEKIIKSQDLGKLKNIVTFESQLDQEMLKQLESRGLKHYTLDEVAKAGEGESKIPYSEVKPDDIFSFSYTSGTTGTPKGVMISHKNIMCVLGCLQNTDVKILPTDIHLSYLPLPHIYERCLYWAMTTCGASIYYYSGDILKLKNDIIDVKPTIFASVPRLFNRFYDAMQTKISEMKGFKASLVKHAIETKLENLRKECTYTHTLYDMLIFKKFREAFGGNVRYMITTSAPISKEVLEFLKIATCGPILEIYGQTESTGGSFVTTKFDPVCGHVGGPTTNCEFKLEDIIEMNYRSTDVDAEGKPMPRGEICIRGIGVMQGYYKSEEQTKETIDADGWLHTGDVGMIRYNGSLQIIDRKKNIFKLSQGEYIAPEKIESIYLRTEGVAEIFVYGDSLQSHLIAMVVPSQDFVEKFAKENQIQGTFQELCQNDQVNKKILSNMNAQAKEGKLAGFEVVKVIGLYYQSFVLAGICTPNMKVKRNDAKLFFQQQITDLYKIKV